MPRDLDWPTRDGTPLALVAELFLDELAPHQRERLLPERGALSFFYDADDQPWGFDPADADGAAVLFVPEPSKHEVRAAPAERFEDLHLDGVTDVTLPPFRSDPLGPLELDDREEEGYIHLLQELEGDTSHRCLGYPDQIQGDMQLEAQLVTHGLYVGNESGYTDPRADALGAGASAWRLLLQLDTEEELGMCWGDAGRIYYWIRADDLRRGAFDATWLILQCF